MNLENDSRWNRRCTAINRRYFEKQLLRNSKDNMLCNSISVDMKVYALQLKQKSTANVFHGILRNFRKILSRIIFGGCFWKENKRPSRCAVNLWIYFFSKKFRIAYVLIWVMSSIFISLRKGFYYQDFSEKIINRYCMAIFHG